jgi:hypothetical protein
LSDILVWLIGSGLVLYCAVLVFMAWKRPVIGILALVSTKFTIDGLWRADLGIPFTPLQVLGIFIPIYLTWIWWRYRRDTPIPGQNYLVLILISAGIASVWGWINNRYGLFPLAASPLDTLSFVGWNFRLYHLFIAIAVAFVLPQLTLRSISWAIVISATLPAIVGFVQGLDVVYNAGWDGLHYSLATRLKGPFYDANTLAMVMFISCTASLFLVSEAKSNSLRVMACLAFLFFATVLFFTYSRTFIVTLIFFLGLFTWKVPVLSLRLLSIATLVAIVMCAPLLQVRFARELGLIGGNMHEMDKLAAGRVGLWQIAADHYIRLDWISKIIGSGGSYGSHNQYIAWTLRQGLLGIILYLGWLTYIIRHLKGRSVRSSVFVGCMSMAFILVANNFSQSWENPSVAMIYGILLGISLRESSGG